MSADTYSLRLPYGDRRIHCSVRPSAKRASRSIAIHVEPDGRVLVDTPLSATSAEVRAAIAKRLAWINRHQMDAWRRRRLVTPREYVSGETLHHLGRRYRLKVVRSDQHADVRMRGSHLEVHVAADAGPDRVREALEHWYHMRARAVLSERVEVVCSRLRWVKQVPSLSVRAMRRQWGSCSPRGKITLNADLVQTSRESIDYVVLHELCHLREHNHGPRFYRLLDAHMPDWRPVKARLDQLAELVLAR